MSRQIEIAELNGPGRFAAYVAEPRDAPKAAIVVIQEVFGVNEGIRAKCDRWAEQGYVAVAPDLFWRIEPGFEVDPDQSDGLERGIAMIQKFDQDQGVADLEATIREARGLAGGGKVGAVGFCMGGRLAFMVATRTDVDAAVGYYGVGIDGLVRESHAIARPVMLHIPTDDGFVAPEVQKAMHEGLDDHPRVTLHDYEGLDHGFADTFGKRRDEAGATLADGRTAEFFVQHLAR
ncbi:dienelactone hydrolase family protein [Sphingomonas sp.]|uniref:dienelactone hydrolase family protein n=1 Tax=Sphingomonas sp. TaxID=28214 RepID=UPI003B009C66